MFDKIKWWFYSKCLGWYMESRCKFVRLSKYRELYISYSWDDDRIYLNLRDPNNTKKSIITLNLDHQGNVNCLTNKGIEIYSHSSGEKTQ